MPRRHPCCLRVCPGRRSLRRSASGKTRGNGVPFLLQRATRRERSDGSRAEPRCRIHHGPAPPPNDGGWGRPRFCREVRGSCCGFGHSRVARLFKREAARRPSRHWLAPASRKSRSALRRRAHAHGLLELTRASEPRLSELRRRVVTGKVRIASGAVATIAAKAAASSDGFETGGILLGFEASWLGEVLVLEAGGPGPNAERRRDFFCRDLGHAQRLANDAFLRTTARWIGEWHTHPYGPLAPSRKDLRTYRRFLRDPELGFKSFIAVIVGSNDGEWKKPRAAAWLIGLRRVLPALLLPGLDRLDIVLENSPIDGRDDDR